MVEHSIGNGEVDSSILSGSTIHPIGDVDFIEISVLSATQECHTDHGFLELLNVQTRPIQRPQFRVRVPAKVVAQLRGRRILLSLGNESDRPFIKVVRIGSDISFSLETDDRLIAEARQANALDHFRRLFELTEADPVNLSHRIWSR